MRDYSHKHSLTQELRKLRLKLALLSTKPQSEKRDEEMGRVNKEIGEIEDYYERNKERIQKHDSQGLQVMARKAEFQRGKKTKFERSIAMTKSLTSQVRVQTAMEESLLRLPLFSTKRIQELSIVQNKLKKLREKLVILKRWRKNYLSNLKPTEVHNSFELEVKRKEFERRRIK